MIHEVRARKGMLAAGARALATVTAVAVLAGAATVPAGASSAGKTAKVTIGIAAITEQSPVVLQAIALDQKIAKLLGFKLVIVNANSSPLLMAQDMSALVNQNVTAIFDIAINPADAPAAFAAAKQKKIPIIGQLGPLIDPTHLAAVSYGPSDTLMGQMLAKQVLKDYPSGGKAFMMEAAAFVTIQRRATAMRHGTSPLVQIVATHETDMTNAVADTQTAVADALHANPSVNMVFGLQDFEFSTSAQTIASQNLGNVGVFSFYLDPQDFGILRADKAAGAKQPMAVVDSPVWDSDWYCFDALVNKYVLHKKNWITAVSVHPFPYTVVTPDNVQATGDVYQYPSFQPSFVKRWKSEGVKVNG